MWNDAQEIFVGSSGQVSFAPIGTTLPAVGADPTDPLDSAFFGTGYLTEDGVTPTFGQQISEYGAWQSATPVRRDRQTQNYQFGFVMQQWNESNVVLAFGGGKVEEHEAGIFSYVFPEVGAALEEFSLVVDAVDGDVHQRFVVPRGSATDDVASTFKRTEPSQLPVTFKALQPDDGAPACYLLTDSPAFATGS
jgi:hypothetical protein